MDDRQRRIYRQAYVRSPSGFPPLLPRGTVSAVVSSSNNVTVASPICHDTPGIRRKYLAGLQASVYLSAYGLVAVIPIFSFRLGYVTVISSLLFPSSALLPPSPPALSSFVAPAMFSRGTTISNSASRGRRARKREGGTLCSVSARVFAGAVSSSSADGLSSKSLDSPARVGSSPGAPANRPTGRSRIFGNRPCSQPRDRGDCTRKSFSPIFCHIFATARIHTLHHRVAQDFLNLFLARARLVCKVASKSARHARSIRFEFPVSSKAGSPRSLFVTG